MPLRSPRETRVQSERLPGRSHCRFADEQVLLYKYVAGDDDLFHSWPVCRCKAIVSENRAVTYSISSGDKVMTEQERQWHRSRCAEYKAEYPVYQTYATFLEQILKVACRDSGADGDRTVAPKGFLEFRREDGTEGQEVHGPTTLGQRTSAALV